MAAILSRPQCVKELETHRGVIGIGQHCGCWCPGPEYIQIILWDFCLACFWPTSMQVRPMLPMLSRERGQKAAQTYWQNGIAECKGSIRLCWKQYTRAHFLSVTRRKLRLCWANHRAGYFSSLACDWLSIVWAYSEQERDNMPWIHTENFVWLLSSMFLTHLNAGQSNATHVAQRTWPKDCTNTLS